MKHIGMAFAIAAGTALSGAASAQPISLSDMGSFHIGGEQFVVSGEPIKEVKFTAGGVPLKIDPNGTYMVGQMYVQYFIPQAPKGAVPLLMWHGGGLSGVTYETTPDGRQGWLNDFLRRGWPVYNSDAVERGRSSWPATAKPVWEGEPVLVTAANAYERFRIGGPDSWSDDPAKRKLLPGSQFPADQIQQFARQFVPRWTTTDVPTLKAYLELVDKVCPCVLLVHSQAGKFGMQAAQLRPEKIRAVVAVEPAEVGDMDKVAAMKNVPMMMVYGDYIEQDLRWPKIRANGARFAEAVRQAGGQVDEVDLPKIGIKGNSHMVMMDKNNLEVSAVINDWLAKRGLYKP
ncbi:esterase [Pigmentiphaga litoralis]|uniref:Pimeloyl-ACP methyl ester carboxylesterase n=1 Tax=Pigmentiphaga litoralis TaxID=516702 RepID=A0A7Y9LN46_9BURK|nr:esterase [Pigmentiphaga litoralis]NYE24050.1 pimeloyl-ACP methyl ester carboxylesterase [Pigmentiphaga litoralis]NYE82336.1 pimeloyl-ACP methyl ester carboxylesterase [Pigmentiphaga litoralis]